MNSVFGKLTLPSISTDPLDLLSKAETGEARELVSEQCQSPSRKSGITSLFFLRMDNPVDFVLARESTGAEFLMFARLRSDDRVFDIYHHKPLEKGFVENAPDFKLTWDAKMERWHVRMFTERIPCETCLYRTRNTAFPGEKPVILEINQGVQYSSKGTQHWFFMDITGVSTADGDRIIECRQCQERKSDSSPGGRRGRTELRLQSTIPTQTPAGDLSIRFLTRGRAIVPSSRNLQIINSTKDGAEIVMQFLKLSASRFNVDFKAPLSPLQAFCLALSTHFWR